MRPFVIIKEVGDLKADSDLIVGGKVVLKNQPGGETLPYLESAVKFEQQDQTGKGGGWWNWCLPAFKQACASGKEYQDTRSRRNPHHYYSYHFRNRRWHPMSGPTSNFSNDPYTFVEFDDDKGGKNKFIEYENPVANFYEREAPDFVEELKATRYPKAPIGTLPFEPSMGAGLLKEDTTGPKPGLAIGSREAQASTTIISPIGDTGKNTFIQICVDVSGSMGAGAGTYRGMGMSRTDVARACVAVMLAQAKAGGDHFALYAFDTNGYVEWPGPSQNYEEAINWLTSIDSDAFYHRGRNSTTRWTSSNGRWMPKWNPK